MSNNYISVINLLYDFVEKICMHPVEKSVSITGHFDVIFFTF